MYYCGANPYTNIPRWYTGSWAVNFKCKSDAKRIATQLGLGYDAVIEIEESLL